MTEFFVSVTSHALDPLPLSQTVTPSRTPSPSSVTYFMDGPIGALEGAILVSLQKNGNWCEVGPTLKGKNALM